MNGFSKAAVAALLTLGLVTTGCSSKGSEAKVATTATASSTTEASAKTTTTVAMPTTTSADDVTSTSAARPTTTGSSGSSPSAQEYYDTVLDKIDAIDTSDFCTGLQGFAAVLKALFDFPTDASGNPPANFDQIDKQLEAKMEQAVKEMGKTLPPNLRADWAVVASTSSKRGEEAATPAEKAASQRVGAWAKAHCHLKSN